MDQDLNEAYERSPVAGDVGQKRALSSSATACAYAERPCEKKLKHCAAEEATAAASVSEGSSGATAGTTSQSKRTRPAALTVLSPLDVASAEQIRQHLTDVHRESFLRPMIAIVTRLMFHKYNHGLFNVRVDPVVWNIPHYFEVVKRPMDLALVKNKCLNLEYASADECAADIRLVFTNACLFNPPGHAVHEAADALLKEFEAEYARHQVKSVALAKRREEHSCPLCLANVCGICNEKCINFEPPLVTCSGPCHQRIKRHSVYYKTPDQSHHWCTKCYISLPKEITLKNYAPTSEQEPETSSLLETTIGKSELVKAKFLDELTEPWVQCDQCSGWVHQICALFNSCENTDENEEIPYTCPLCRIKELDHEAQSWDIESPIGTSVDEFPNKFSAGNFGVMGSHSPVLKRKHVAKDFTRVLGFDIEDKVFDYLGDSDADRVASLQSSVAEGLMNSQKLRSSMLSRFMQAWVRQHLIDLGEIETARSITVKVVSSIKTSCQVSPVVRKHFKSKTLEYPQSIDFTSKAIFIFQKINGVEVCIFSMYVQEYDKDCVFTANRNRTYIAYLDSLVYMRPRHVRTSLFQEILISYLAFCKAKDFHYAHIWACPTTRGGDFIYWCHPTFQKNPGKDRLLQWYSGMSRVAKRSGVVFACDDFYSSEFEHLEENLETQLPPYFDGDYWSAEAERLEASPPKRGKKSKEAYEESLRGASFRKKVVDSVKASRESLFVIALQPKCSECDCMIVNSPCWKMLLDTESADVYICPSCHTQPGVSDQPMEKVLPPSFASTRAGGKEDEQVSCLFLDHRPDMLKNCEEHHYQFDSFRRAKYSTMMLIYQIYSTQQPACKDEPNSQQAA